METALEAAKVIVFLALAFSITPVAIDIHMFANAIPKIGRS